MALLCVSCSVDVREQGRDRTDVDIRTPAGDISVRANRDAVDTGLPIYPGATALRDDDDSGGADVNIGAFGFGLKVTAAKFESPDGPEAILGFYRHAMESYGAVTECQGDIDFRRGRPICRSRGFKPETHLVVGTEDNHRIAVVVPRGPRSEFALVRVRTSGS